MNHFNISQHFSEMQIWATQTRKQHDEAFEQKQRNDGLFWKCHKNILAEKLSHKIFPSIKFMDRSRLLFGATKRELFQD